MKEFIDEKCPNMKYVDIAKGCGFSVGYIYSIRHRETTTYQMSTVLRMMFGLSRLLKCSAEDLFVEYILGEVRDEYPLVHMSTVRSWLNHYKEEGETLKDLSIRVGIEQTSMSDWFHRNAFPTDTVLRWLLIAMEGHSSEQQCRSFFRVTIEQRCRL